MGVRDRRGLHSAPGIALALCGLLAGAAGAAGGDEAPGAPGTDAEAGEYLFRMYCVSCHGHGAAGDGPVADQLRTPPADLTRISQRNEGRFPSARVFRKIDGRWEVPAHGPSDMPVWGFSFQQRGSDANQEAEVERKIRQLVVFLETIQVPPER